MKRPANSSIHTRGQLALCWPTQLLVKPHHSLTPQLRLTTLTVVEVPRRREQPNFETSAGVVHPLLTSKNRSKKSSNKNRGQNHTKDKFRTVRALWTSIRMLIRLKRDSIQRLSKKLLECLNHHLRILIKIHSLITSRFHVASVDGKL